VLEGTDGSGKTAQFNLLKSRLKKSGLKVETVDFPQYEKPSSYFIKQYLNGKYGGWKEVGPYKASIFYAVDRFDVGAQIKKWLKEGKVVISNRYVASNMGHQGAKMKKIRERKNYFKWLYKLEYDILEIPRPTTTIVLHVPAKIAQELVGYKGPREYIGGVKKDIHEADLNHLKAAEKTYIEMVKIFPKDFSIIECVKKNRLLSIKEIHEKVWDIVKKVLK